MTEYKRIIDRNAQLGVTHIVYEPRNTLHSDRHNSTDGWGWEASLWFSMGEQIREGVWEPQADTVPQDILDMVTYAKSKGVGLWRMCTHALRSHHNSSMSLMALSTCLHRYVSMTPPVNVASEVW